MIVSHRHKFIFLKTVKTGGTSVEISLSRFCGPEDVITPISPEDEAIRREMGIQPRNFLAERSEYAVHDWLRLAFLQRRKLRFWNHITARDARRRLGEQTWNRYYKFTIERNPWDKTVSDFHWRRSLGGPQTWEAYFRRYGRRFRQFNYPRYTMDGQLAVDCVLRFENLIPDLTDALRRVGVEFDGWLPRAKGKSRSDRRHYSEVLTSGQQALIAERFAPEIQLMNYQLETVRAA